MTSESTRPVGKDKEVERRERGSLLLQSFPVVLHFGDDKSNVISEAPTLCPGLTCSQEAESHTAEEPGAIDCSPSLGLITINSLTAADSVMIPVQPEFFALEGLGKLLTTIRLVQGGPNKDLTIEGFVVTMFDGRTKVHNQVLGQLKEHFGSMVFETIIQRNIRLSEAPSHGKPIILYDVICNGTTNYLNLAKEVLEKNC